MAKIGVITASGIGDGLIFHTLSHHLVTLGHEVTTFNDHLPSFGPWLPSYSLAPQPNPRHLSSFDFLILQHDNSPKALAIKSLPCPIYTFYGAHLPAKHGPLTPLDYVCDRTRTMLDNLTLASLRWFNSFSRENGLTPPPHLIHRKYSRRIILHDRSSRPEKNWPHFSLLAKKLEHLGYEPTFLFTPEGTPLCPTLADLATHLYESGAFLGNDSGPGHLASYLQIPSLILAQDPREMALWRPGWGASHILTPPHWTTHFKWTRQKWKFFLSKRQVFKTLKNILEN